MYKVGDKIKFKSEKKPYRIVACNSRYLICMKPFNLRQTYLYVIVDLQNKIRGPDNLLFSHYDLRVSGDADKMLNDLMAEKIEVSRRHGIKLDLDNG